jgi:hypothetical protein
MVMELFVFPTSSRYVACVQPTSRSQQIIFYVSWTILGRNGEDWSNNFIRGPGVLLTLWPYTAWAWQGPSVVSPKPSYAPPKFLQTPWSVSPSYASLYCVCVHIIYERLLFFYLHPSVSTAVERPSYQIDVIANCARETAKTDEGRDGQRM